jgi:hypothetical protein
VSVQPMRFIRPPVTPMATNMRHVVQLVLPLPQFVATPSRQLSRSDFVNLLPLNSLDKHARQPGEEAPIGLILCAESRTQLSPKAELEQKLHAALLEARERLARRGVLLGTWLMSDEILPRAKTSRRLRGCSMWRRRGRRRGC